MKEATSPGGRFFICWWLSAFYEYLLDVAGREAHDGIIEQCQLTFGAIIAVRCRDCDKLGCHIDHVNDKVVALTDIGHQVAATHNQAVTSLHAVRPIIEVKRACPPMAIGMAQIAGMIADTSQPILNDNVFRSIHRAQIYSFSTKKQNRHPGNQKKKARPAPLRCQPRCFFSRLAVGLIMPS